MTSRAKQTIFTALIVVFGFVAIVGGGFAVQAWNEQLKLNALAARIESGSVLELLKNLESAEDSVGQALSGVKVAQGRQGAVIWSLDAEWAALRQGSGLIEVRDPKIVYPLDGSATQTRYVRASAEFGVIMEDSNILSLRGNVLASLEEDSLSGPVAIFRNDAKLLEFPDGGIILTPSLNGQADELWWSMESNTLAGQGNVRLVWFPAPAK